MKNERATQSPLGEPTSALVNGKQALMPGPVSFMACWLGNAFDRTRVNKREAEARRRRFL